MNADVARAERFAEVRRAVRAWRDAGVVGDEAVRRVDELYPDDRHRAGPVLRILLGVFTFVAGIAALGFAGLVTQSGSPSLLLAATACGLTDYLVSSRRRTQGGVEEGLAALSFVLVLFAVGWTADDVANLHDVRVIELVLATAAVAGVAVVWRWGMPAFAVVSAVALYVLLAQWASGRVLWVAMALAVAWPLLAARRAPRLPPSARAGADGALAISLAALYIALNHALAEHGFVEVLAGGRATYGPSGWFGPFTAVATVVLPLAVLTAGVRMRDRLVLFVGGLMAVASLVTLRYYVHIAPLWVLLVAGGGALIALALLLSRLLASGANRERAGFTAEPLFGGSNRQRLLEIAATLVTLTPEARALPAEKAGFEPARGSFGGGGASESF